MQIKNFTLFTFLLVLWSGATAQVVLTAEANNPPPGYTDSIYISLGGGLLAPEGGTDMTWDFSNLPPSVLRVVELSDETNNSVFPEAVYGSPGSIQFQFFEADAVIYAGGDEEGTYDIGNIVTEASFPLTPITGNPDDTFTFVGDTTFYEGRVNELQYPMTYPDQISGSRIQYTNVELSVAAFGLSNAPVQVKRLYREDRSVIGYGQLIIPMEDHSPSPPIDALLMQVERMWVDSFFLYGTLPPQPLLDAFSVSQGMTNSYTYYVFYTPGLSSPVADVGINNDGTISDVYFRPRAADLVLATLDFTPAEFSLSPNPIQSGQSIHLKTDQDLAGGQVHVFHLNGQLVANLPLNDRGGDQSYQLQLPNQLAPGMYLLQAFDQRGRLFRAEKVIIE